MLGLAGFGLLLRTAIAVLTTTVRVIPAVIRIIVTTTAKLTTATVAATSTSTSISTTKTSCTSPAISWGCPKHGLCMELSPARIPSGISIFSSWMGFAAHTSPNFSRGVPHFCMLSIPAPTASPSTAILQQEHAASCLWACSWAVTSAQIHSKKLLQELR